MISAIIFAQVWGVMQLVILTSPARTVRVRTVFAAMAAGFYAIGPLTAFIQLTWIRRAAPLFHLSPYELQAIAAYSIDPIIEEAMKLTPLALLMLIPAIRRQWSITDCVLIAAATGSGFGLTEHLFRYAAYPHLAQAVSGGWMMSIGFARVFVPGFLHTLTSWVTNGAYVTTNPVDINWHLAWSAIGGLAVGLVVRKKDRRALLVGAGLFVFIGLDHAAANAGSNEDTWLADLAVPMHLVARALGFLAFTTLVVAGWLDQPSRRAGMLLGPMLSAEEAASSHVLGTFTAALSRLPWSLPWVYGFDRERRAYHAVRAANPGEHTELRAAVIAHRDKVERQLTQDEPPALWPSWLTPDYLAGTLRRALKRPPVVLWLLLIAPSVLFLIVGGWPQTAGLQRLLNSAFVWPIIVFITVVNQGRIAWRVITGVRGLPAAARLPTGDDAALLGLQLACGVGTVVLGGFTLTRVWSGIGVGERLMQTHASDAINRATAGSAAAAANSASAFSPPGPQDESGAESPGLPDTNAAEDTAPPVPSHPTPRPPPPAPTPQQQAAAAAAAAAQAQADAQAAAQARTQAFRDADSASIRQATADPGSDPEVAAAQARTRAAHDTADAASRAASEPDDPWNPSTQAAQSQAQQAAQEAEQAQRTAENNFQNQLAADNAAARQAANDAETAANAAAVNAATAQQTAAAAQAAADNAAAKAAVDAARAADPAQAAADDAAREYAAAKARENAAFSAKGEQQYHDARAALDAAKAKADAAQAAADAARKEGSSITVASRRKP